jgi:hypothetical protein
VHAETVESWKHKMVITEWSLHVLIQEEAQRECSGNCGQCVQSIGFLKQFGGAHDLGMTTVNSSRSCCNFFDGVPTTRVVSLFQLQTLSVEGIIHDPLLLGVTLEACSLTNCFSL